MAVTVRGENLPALRGKAPADGLIPITPDGRPDLAAMLAFGMNAQVDTYEKRMMAVGRFRARMSDAKRGKRREVQARVAAECGMTARHLRRLDRILREAGPLALVPTKGLSQRRQYKAIPRVLQAKILEASSDYTRRTAAQVYDTIVRPWCESQDLKAPCYRTVCKFLEREMRPIEESAFRVGPQDFRAHFAAKVQRELSSIETNEVWVADHRLFDLFVLRDGKPKRPWLTAIFDVRTAALVGYEICGTPSSVSVAHALRRAISDVGTPQKFLRDNGKEFTSKRLGGKPVRLRKPTKRDLGERKRWPAALPGDLESGALWSALGIELVTAIPFSPWSKPVESFFGAMSGATENLLPGWAGRNARAKPEILQKHIAEGRLLEWAQFVEVFADLAAWWNERHTCGSRTETPAAAYARHEARIPDAQALAVLMQDVRVLKVRPHGVTVDGRTYLSEELGPYVGMPVTMRRDPGEPQLIFCYTSDGRVLAVPEIPRADWNGFGPANLVVKEVERGQRAYLRAKRAERSGHCTERELDPFGAFGRVRDRLTDEKADMRHETLALEAAAREAELQIEAKERAEKEGPDEDHEVLRRMGRRLFKEQDERERCGAESHADLMEKARSA